ncbi:hypothetical protein WJX74_002723 [Apatococcus lobatus]|uniref:AB hydrolase-1 domain-containing protein n=1 Tax=Apatococcus lobatus TaxID=904363 RepID=A0AAW1QUY0_9CHLO
MRVRSCSCTFAVLLAFTHWAPASSSVSGSKGVRTYKTPLQHEGWDLTVPFPPDVADATPIKVLVETDFYFPADGVLPELPWVLLLNGYDVRSREYTGLLEAFALRGYMIAAPDYRRYWPTNPAASAPQYQEPGCDNTTFTLASLSLLNTVHRHLRRELEAGHSPHLEHLAGLDIDNVVLLGHSMGGLISMQALTGMCNPDADPNSKPTTALFCEGYKPLLDSHGDSIVQGAFIYEGNPITEPSKPGEGPIFSNVTIPQKSFVAYFGSPSYSILLPQLTHTHGGCAQLTVLSSGNHYGITNFYNSSDHQISPCHVQAPWDPADYHTDMAAQAGRIDLFSMVSDAAVKAFLLDDQTALQYLKSAVSQNPGVQLHRFGDQCTGLAPSAVAAS